MPYTDNRTYLFGAPNCRYYGRDTDTRCRADVNYSDPHFRTHCMGCDRRIQQEDPQVLLDRARAAFIATQEKIAEIRRVTGRNRSAMSTLSCTREALAATETLMADVIARA